jgi:hypothetical protein
MKFIVALALVVALASAQTASDYTWVGGGTLKTYIIDADGDFGSKVGDCNVTSTGYSTSSWKGLTNDDPSNANKAAACSMYTIPEQTRPTPPTPPFSPTPTQQPTPFAPVPTPRFDGYFFVVGCASAYNTPPTPVASPTPFPPFSPTPFPPTPMVGNQMVRYFEWGWTRSDCLDDATVILNSNTDGFGRNSDTCIGTNIQSPIMVNGVPTTGQVQFRVSCSATTYGPAFVLSVVAALFVLLF